MNDQQQQILIYLYRFRFLNRNQIQQLLHHKYFNRVIIWLNQLTKEGYIRRYYNPKTVTVPAIYSLGLSGRKYLNTEYEGKDIKTIVLDRVWREHTLSQEFRNHCLFIANIYLSLLSLTQQTGITLFFRTKSDLYGMKYLILPYPDIFFSIEEKNRSKKYYFLDVFNELPARMVLRKRVQQYIEYYRSEYWQDHTQKAFPNIIFICPDERSKNYLKKFIQKVLEEEPELNFYLSTKEKIKFEGFNRGVLQKVTL